MKVNKKKIKIIQLFKKKIKKENKIMKKLK